MNLYGSNLLQVNTQRNQTTEPNSIPASWRNRKTCITYWLVSKRLRYENIRKNKGVFLELPPGRSPSWRTIFYQKHTPLKPVSPLQQSEIQWLTCSSLAPTQETYGLCPPCLSAVDLNLITNIGVGMELTRILPSLPPVGLGQGTLTVWICWNLWISRNQLTFQKRDFTPEEW